MKSKDLQKWYTRIIGVAFVLVVITLITNFLDFGFNAEIMHKLFHVILGSIVLKIGWDNKRFWKPFCLVNGAFFTYVAIFGWLFPNYAGLHAFNFLSSVLHSIVGLSGLVIGVLK